MSEPLITAGITCYNARQSIRRAVEGALRQTCQRARSSSSTMLLWMEVTRF